MKAQQFDPKTRQVQLTDIEIPEPSENEILVKVLGSSLCSSDRLLFDPDFFLTKSLDHPVTMGHEATGIIIKVGGAVESFSIGDAVGFLASSGCFECAHCKTYSSYGCPKGLKAQGFNCNGYLQEYIVVDARSAARLPPNLDVATSAPLCCAGVTAYNAVKGCKPQPGKWLAVIGAGGVGKMAIQYAKAMGFKVVAVDVDKDQLDDAKRAGADYTFKPSDLSMDRVEVFLKKTGGGVDAAVNFTSSSQSYTDMQCLIKFNGILMVVGIADELKINPIDISFRRLIIKGASNGTTRDLKKCFKFSAKHGVKAFYKAISLEDVPDVVERMKSGPVRERMVVVF
ncbi:related to Alcohol dehydrogenase [Fusarium torulosum]|uniref:Related to Alcohol dehydrogenase n=1 Tax=Fusarium torulosum TaxID=33205 RepID=A0AAE8MLP1_9HYPO|nr:related to Alcohol dehydrogenase [Fusarium torulosum]